MSLVVVGSVAYDAIETPHGKRDRTLGGACTYIALSASFFTKPMIVGVVGEDFAAEDQQLLVEKGVDLEGLERVPGKTFFWSGVYSQDMNDRKTLQTDLNVFADFQPKLPASYPSQPYLFLGNIQPSLQRDVQMSMPGVRFVGGDTMNYWIQDYRGELLETIKTWDFLLINDSEARMLADEQNLRKAADKILALGPNTLIIKRGEYGAMLFRKDTLFMVPGYLLEDVFDPTGAGDCFAGGFVGYLAERGFDLRNGDFDVTELHRAVIYGSVMGSFCCEEFGVDRFRSLTRKDIDDRFEEFRRFTEFWHLLSETVLAAAALAAVTAGAVLWFYRHGYLLYYGDAQSHLNIARGLVDSKTPGYNQLGTVWLPLLHLLCAPFAQNDWLWSSGLAGSIPVAACFVVAGGCLYASARQVFESSLAAAVVLACLALNPNMLYLASIPMTEQVFLAGLSVCLLAAIRFRATQSYWYAAVAVASLWAMCMTRYDGWFLIPFTAFWFAGYAQKNKLRVAFVVLAGASCAPLYWFAHCWWLTGNALDFYNGPYSAMAIQGGRPYPGFHNWGDAVFYYGDAARLCASWPLLILGLMGCACAIAAERFSALGYLWLIPLFYVWSIHSSGNPCYGPRWFNSYYNTRYALAVVVACAFASGALVEALGQRRRQFCYALPAFAVLPWILHPGAENWICWKESQVNSIARRDWTARGAAYFEPLYLKGQGVLTSAGDVTGVYCKSRIHLSETLNVGNVPWWYGAGTRPDLAYDAAWAVTQAGDQLSKAIQAHPQSFELIQDIKVKGAPALEIYRRRIGNINRNQ